MALDLIALGLVVVYAVLGWKSGLSIQLARIGALVVAYAAARALGETVGGALATKLSPSPAVRAFFGMAVVLVVTYAALSFLATVLLSKLQKDSKAFAAFDHPLGAVAGGLKGAAFAYLAVCAALFGGHFVTLPFDPTAALTGRIAKGYNVFERGLPAAAELPKVIESVRPAGPPGK